MRGVAAITEQQKLPLRKPVQQMGEQLSCDLSRRLVAAAFMLIQQFRAIQTGEHRQ